MEGKPKTVVLVGRTGHGKSATCNSILGRKAFESKFCAGGVTTKTEQQSTPLEDGSIINVIDTPGLFDFHGDTEFLGNEIAKCINLANDGLHAIVLVLSIRGRFSKEEEAAVQALSSFFGPKILGYLIVIFTGGDELEADDQTLDDYLGGTDCPKPLQDTLTQCGNRQILFNNRTKIEAEKSKQRNQFLSLVNDVVKNNGGIPYTDPLFIKMKDIENQLKEGSKNASAEQMEEMKKAYEEQQKIMIASIEAKFKETLGEVKQNMAAEQERNRIANEKLIRELLNTKVAQAKAEAHTATLEAQLKAQKEIHDMEKQLDRLKLEAATEEAEGSCAIL
ncbi:hypothetical protein ABFX02_12G012500 [Erythranthe guttata]